MVGRLEQRWQERWTRRVPVPARSSVSPRMMRVLFLQLVVALLASLALLYGLSTGARALGLPPWAAGVLGIVLIGLWVRQRWAHLSRLGDSE